MIHEAIQGLVDGRDLTQMDATSAMAEIMTGDATPAQIGAFVTALRMKGETVDEVTGLAAAMRGKATPIAVTRSPIVDTCGTGGDGSHTFNISTAAAFVVAGAGVAVAKHGNRAASSQCGSADVLLELGVNVDADPEVVGRCVDEAGIGFLFAVKLHGAMKHAIGPRREIGIRTVFNILGPMTNPAGARHQLIGVFDAAWTERIAGALGRLGSDRAFVVHGSDGLDEITVTGTTRVSELRDGAVRTSDLDPRDLGFDLAAADTLKGGDAGENAGILRDVLGGAAGPRRDIVLLNAAAALVAVGAADDMTAGVVAAADSVDSGRAAERLADLVRVSNSET
ncbi:anthranilate phosphoribosyltransferase [Candidatus Poribacteria bacterium]|nr:anthranilate phosphoribosyltransferase [Candidatus Poribacteria bacterium]MBT7101262.1 anthranilate phosphoribosyltransferase [Candidatus Poribacteria bacterium]